MCPSMHMCVPVLFYLMGSYIFHMLFFLLIFPKHFVFIPLRQWSRRAHMWCHPTPAPRDELLPATPTAMMTLT